MRGNSFASATGKAIPTVGIGGGSSGALELIEAHEVGVAETSYTFAGLDGDTDDLYLVAYKVIKNGAAAMTVDLRPNGLTTNQLMKGTFDGTGSGPFNATAIRIVDTGGASGNHIGGQFWFNAKTGTFRMGRGNWSETDGTNLYFHDAAMVWNETVTNITSFDVVCSLASGIGAGSYVRLYRLKAV